MDRDALIGQLIKDEGIRLKPYRDPENKLTIGIGRNLDANGITEDEALMLCGNDVARVESDLDRAFPWWRAMTERRQQALANMCFNLGLPRLLTFRKALAAMQAGTYAKAATEMLDSQWAEQVGARASRLAIAMREG